MSPTSFVIASIALLAGFDGPAAEVAPREILVLRAAGEAGRGPIAVDPVAASLVEGRFATPKAGDEVRQGDGPARAWSTVRAEADGSFRVRGGYAFASIPSDRERVMILEASGHGGAYVDGEPRAGDPYGYGFVRLPVALKAGETPLLLAGGRGSLRFRLVEPRAKAMLEVADSTLPDLVEAGDGAALGAVVVVNASRETLEGAVIDAEAPGEPGVTTPVPSIPPLGGRKVGFGFRVGADSVGPVEVKLVLKLCDGGAAVDSATVKPAVVPAGKAQKRTFRSGIDGSVQYYGLVPAGGGPALPEGRKPGLILSLHGASVEGIGQARVYKPKPWAHVVAPTNRRPYGFDWEDWGRLDALEVLNLTQLEFETDRRRTFLTGHSMGGHGTWHLGVTFPDRFAAIAPSAGWVSFASYAGGNRGGAAAPSDPVAALVRRASAPSDTLALVRNTAELGVYVLHGDADDNVPVGQARTMRKALGEFHPDFAYHERPGAGHWWGDECVDWPPLIEFLDRHTIPEPKAVRRIDFRTAQPGVSSRSHWATIESQVKAFEPSALRLDCDPDARSIAGTTENVRRLSFDLGHLKPGGPVAVTLDGRKVEGLPEAGAEGRAWLARDGDAWKRIDPPSPALKNPGRSGPFKDAFRNRMILIHGTKGTAEENAWSLARARLDAETFWYRGNGSIDVAADTGFDPHAEPDRNVILYGNAETNAAWAPLLGDGPIRVDREGVRVGPRSTVGPGLACLFVRPRPGSDRACVAAVAGTGINGLRLTQRLPYFVSGVAYPDFLLVGPEALTKGAAGFLGAGYFGDDWSVDGGEFAWLDQ